jgi:hypothetical protein
MGMFDDLIPPPPGLMPQASQPINPQRTPNLTAAAQPPAPSPLQQQPRWMQDPIVQPAQQPRWMQDPIVQPAQQQGRGLSDADVGLEPPPGFVLDTPPPANSWGGAGKALAGSRGSRQFREPPLGGEI